MTATYTRVLALAGEDATGHAVAARAWQFARSQAARLALAPLALAGAGMQIELDGAGRTRFLETLRRKLLALAASIGAPDAELLVGETLLSPGAVAEAWRPDLAVCARQDGGGAAAFRTALDRDGPGCDAAMLSLPRIGLPRRGEEPPRYRHILAIGDMSRAGLAAIERAAQLSEAFNCRLTVGAALDYTPGIECGQLPVMTPAQFRREARADLQRRLGRAAARPGAATPEVIVAEGSPQDVEEELAAQLRPDLIVTAGSGGFGSGGHGENAHDVLRVHVPNAAVRFARALARFGGRQA